MAAPGPDRELMSAADVSRTISRIAHQIIEKTALDGPDAPRVVLLGIPTRGVTLAARLAHNITEFSSVTVKAGALDVTLYRDDLNFKPPRPLEDTSIPDGGVDDAVVVLVDDVLYSATWAGRARCSWPPWSIADTGNCRCAPTTSARTCPRPAATTSRSC
jgi:pyrimidine operon attenuation protein/uracil phosphoribosyltransferase